MQRLCAVIFAIFLSSSCFSQTVTVKSKATGEPIPDVYVYDLKEKQSASTKSDGVLNLKAFLKSEYLVFQHPAYLTLTISTKFLIEESELFLTEKIVQMDELVISANKWEQSSADIPSTIAVIGSKDIEFQNPQTAADVLEGSGKVFVQKSQMGGGSPMIRGFSANSVLIVVDGVRLNNAIFRSGNLHNVLNIDPSMLENTEVIFGPGSVVYGSDALGGVMDFHTITPSYSDKRKLKTAVLTRYSSANQEKTSHLKLSISNEKVGIFGGVSFSDFGDLRSGANRTEQHPEFGKRIWYQDRINDLDIVKTNDDENVQRASGYKQWSGLGKIRVQLNDQSELRYGLYFSNTTDIPRYDRLILLNNNIPVSSEWSYGPQKWLRNSLRYQTFKSTGIFDSMKATLSHQNFKESRRTRDYGSDIRTVRSENVDLITLNIDFDKKLQSSTNVFYGGEIAMNRVGSTAFSEDINSGLKSGAQTRYPDGTNRYDSYAIYSTLNRPVSDQVTLSVGGRLNTVVLNSMFVDKTFFDFPYSQVDLTNTALNGNVGLVFKPSPKWKIDLLAASGFRAPNIDDTGKLFDSEPGNVVVPNPDLSPEKAYNIDLGLSRSFKDRFKIELTAFHTWASDLIVRRDFTFNGMDSIMYDGILSRVQALDNAEKAIIYGLSIYIKAQFNENIGFTSTFNYTDGQDNQGLPIRHAAPPFGRSTLLFKKEQFKFEFYVIYNGKLGWEDLAPSEQNKPHLYTSDGSPGWSTINATASMDFSNLQVNIGLENMLDKHYRPYSSGISAPGRNLVASLKFEIN